MEEEVEEGQAGQQSEASCKERGGGLPLYVIK